MILLLIVALLAFAIIGVATTGDNSHSNFETKYSKHNLKIVNGDYPCCNCSYFYDGKIDSYPFVPNEERPHPPYCVNRKRYLENKSKCYVRDTL